MKNAKLAQAQPQSPPQQQRVKVNDDFINYVPEWPQAEGSGAATRKMCPIST
ncbi:hypothetical protein ACVW1C_004557 [Bradyrhizobium sp. USDA 4011]